MIFDLDGTLVQTEQLKALSYARAAAALCPTSLAEEDIMEAYKDVVGLSRQEVATALMRRFDLENAARVRMNEFSVSTPWQAFIQLRLQFYDDIVSKPEVLQSHQWPYTMALLGTARSSSCKVGLATMSRCSQVRRVLDALALSDAFDFIATRDDVNHGKPDPEIYLLVARTLESAPVDCLVIEDSPSGVKAAVEAGMNVVAVSTPFTRDGLHRQNLIPAPQIIDDPVELAGVVERIVSRE